MARQFNTQCAWRVAGPNDARAAIRHGAWAPWLCLALSACTPGCAENALALKGQLQTLQQQHLAQAERYRELESRVVTLDRDNQEVGTLLAQRQQQVRVLEDQVTALQEQLKSSATELARRKQGPGSSDNKTETFSASTKRRLDAPSATSNSTLQALPLVKVPGVEVRADGDVVRIELPGQKIFEPGSARLLPQAGPFIDAVAVEIDRSYVGQIIGVEGHTDSDPVRSGGWVSNHQLSVGRAMAVYDYLAGRTRLKPDQLFIVGHGSNHPVVSNGTSAGKERNRRVELVIYPERPTRR